MFGTKLVSASVTAFALFLAVACSAAENGPQRYISGEHYTVVDKPVATETGDKIEVIEFFLYGCGHCYAFDPMVNAWVDKLPDDVEFRRVPVTFSSVGPLFARTFYTAQKLGVLDKLHSKLFDALHKDGVDLTSPAAIRKFFIAQGVDGKKFDSTFKSDKVSAHVKHADQLMRAYLIQGVPALAVNGSYTVNGRQAGSNDGMLDVASFLINKAKASK